MIKQIENNEGENFKAFLHPALIEETRKQEVRTSLWSLTVIGAVISALHGALYFIPALRLTIESFYMQNRGYLGHRSCEGIVAVAFFYVWGFFFSFLEYGRVPRLRTWRVKAADAGHVREVVDTNKGTFGVGTEPAKPEVFTGPALPFAIWIILNTVLYLGIIELGQRLMGDLLLPFYGADDYVASPWRIAVEVAFSVLAYDFLIWFVHASWHRDVASLLTGGQLRSSFSGGGWQKLHLHHHDHYTHPQDPLSPMSALHHHLLDAGLQVGINVLVQQLPLPFLFGGSPRHKLSKIVHNIVVTYLLIEAHSGFDLWFMSHRLMPSLFGGSVRHQIHHQQGTVFYHQFFKYFDNWLFDARNVVQRFAPMKASKP